MQEATRIQKHDENLKQIKRMFSECNKEIIQPLEWMGL